MGAIKYAVQRGESASFFSPVISKGNLVFNRFSLLKKAKMCQLVAAEKLKPHVKAASSTLVHTFAFQML